MKTLKLSFRFLILFFFFTLVYFLASNFFSSRVEAASSAGPKGALTIVGTSLPVWIASAGETFNVTVRLSDFSSGGSTTISTSSLGGASFSPGSTSTSVPALGSRDVVFSINAPNEGVNSCPVGRNDFEIRFSSPEYGWVTQNIQLYASVGLTISNSRSTAVNATVTYTSWGGLTGQTVSVGGGGSNGPAFRWAVNCGTYPTVTIGVTVDGVTYYGTSNTVNGCSFQVNISIPPSGGGPSPTPSPPPGVDPPKNLSASPGCFGTVPVVTFNWQLGASNNITIDVSDNNWGSFHNRNMGNTTSLSWNPWDPMSDGFAPSINRTYQWRLWDGTQHTYGPNVSTGDCGGGGGPSPVPTPSPPVGTCPVGCSGPTQTVTWNRPTGHVTFADPGGVTSNCSSTGTSCNSAAVYWPGSTVLYNVRLSSSGGIIVKTAGTNSGSDLRASASWDWDYDVIWCEVPTSSDKSCFGNPTVRRVSIDNSTSSTISRTLTGLKPTQYYAYQIEVRGTSSSRELTNGNFRSGGCGCPSPTPKPASPLPTPSVPQIPTANSPTTPTCVTVGQTYGSTMNLTWNNVAGATSYTVRLTANTKTNGDFAIKTSGANSTTGTGGWSTGGNPLVTWVSSTNLALQPNVTYFFAVKAVGPGGDSGYDLVNKSAQIGPAPPCGPANPSNLSAAFSCDTTTGTPEIRFSFSDNSTNEELFWIDVNSSPWSGPGGPSPWGFKTLTSNAGTGNVFWIWTASDSLSGGPPTVPLENRTYYWRVRAHNNGGDSAHVYPPNSLAAPGTSINTLDCPDAEFDMSASIVPGSWTNSRGVTTQTFDVGEQVHLDVRVYNNSAGTSPATQLYFFYDASNIPNCPSSPSSGIPPDGSGVPQGYSISPIGPGASTTVPISFRVGQTPTTETSYAYIVPACSFAPALGTDPNYSNNQSNGFTYSIEINKFFESRDGDVGAAVNIGVAFNSSNITPTGKYQSGYVIAASDLNDNTSSKNRMTIDSYNKPQVPGGGVYNFFASRFRSKADPTPVCSLNNGTNYGSTIKNCPGHVVVASATQIGGNAVFFIDGDLDIRANLTLSNSNDTAVFIVKGDIRVVTGVTRIDGVYIARKSFFDSNTADPGVLLSGAFNLFGGLYVDAEEGGQVSLRRYFTIPINNLAAADVFVYQPKYLVTLGATLGARSIEWREVDP